VLIAHDVEDRGGMERSLFETVRHGASEVDFCVVSSTLACDLRDRVEWRRVAVPRRPFLLKFAVFYLLGWLRVAMAGRGVRQTTGAIVPNRADVAVVHFCHAAYLTKARRSTPAPLPGLKAWHESLIRRVSVRAERWSYRRRRLSSFVAVSSGVRRDLEGLYPGIPCVVAPNGVDHRRFRPNRPARAAIREQLEVRPGDFVAVFVGGDWARKGLDIAIAAAGEVRRSHGVAVTLWVVGPGHVERYRALARAEGVAGGVRFLGPRSDTERFYQAADAFVLPSMYETFSLAAVEAAACGVPIVATLLDGVVEEFAAAGAALICDRSSLALAQALVELARDPVRGNTLARAAHEHAKRYTWERQATKLLALYEDLAGQE
jgi:glycosyltransferase involved in cell wall biosynthesis